MSCADKVIERARSIVTNPPTKYGYVDVGDVLVDYLRSSATEAEALERLGNLELTYERTRQRNQR